MVLWATATVLAVLLVIAAATALEEKAKELEEGNVVIQHEVKEAEGGNKYLELYYYKDGRRKDLAELLPLDIWAFVDRGMAEHGDVLEVEFRHSELIARILVPTQASRILYRRKDWPCKAYKYPIHQAGGIGYVRLSKWWRSKLYYVRVPPELFPQLDSKALQKYEKGVTDEKQPLLPSKTRNC